MVPSHNAESVNILAKINKGKNAYIEGRVGYV